MSRHRSPVDGRGEPGLGVLRLLRTDLWLDRCADDDVTIGQQDYLWDNWSDIGSDIVLQAFFLH